MSPIKQNIRRIIIIALIFCNHLLAQNTKNVSTLEVTTDEAGDTYALIIGISKYQNIQSLEFADRDALAFYNYLRSKAGGEIDSLNIQLLLNEAANVGNVSMGLQWLRDVVNPNDNVIIYFSGHGDIEKLTDAQNGFLLTHNSPKASYWAGGTIPLYILKDYISTLSGQDSKVTLIADACRSGKLAGGKAGTSQTGAALQQQWGNEVKILSCQPGELSLESRNIGGGRGLFSYHLIRGLMGLADMNKDSVVSLSELFIYLSQKVPQEADPLPQNPIMSGNMQSRLANVDHSTLEALLDDANPNLMLASVNTKGLLGNHEDLGESWKKKYRRFENYLEEGNSYHPTHPSAWSVYNEFKDSISDRSLIKVMERNLVAGLQNEAQLVTNGYLRGDFEFAAMPQHEEQQHFEMAARKMELCQQLISKNNPLQHSLKARQLFLEARAVVRIKDPNVLNEALLKLDSSITIEPYAAYSYNTKGLIFGELENREAEIIAYSKASELAPTWAFPLNNVGIVYYNLKEYDQAISYYQKAIALDSSYTHAYNNLGNVYDDLKEYDQAISYYQKAIALDSSHTHAYHNLGNVYDDLKEYDQAISYYQKAIALDSSYTYAYNGLGNVYNDLKEYDKAISYYQKAIALDSSYTYAYNGLGIVYYNLKEYDKAISYYQKAIALDSSYTYAYNGLGIVYHNFKEYDKAISYYQKAIALDSSYTNAYNGLGIVYYNLKEYDQAISCYQKAIALDSSYTYAYHNLGNVYDDLKEYDRAISYYQKAIALDSSYTRAYHSLGIVYHNLKEYDQAINYYQKAIALNSSYTYAYHNLGNVYDDLKEYDRAISYYQKAIALDSSYTRAYHGLGIVYHNLKEYDQAINYYQKAIALDSSYTYAYHNLGIVYDDLKEYDQAIRHYKNAVDLDPNLINSYYNIALIYNNSGLYKEAMYYFLKAFYLDPYFLETAAFLRQSISTRAYELLRQQKFNHSLQLFERCIEILPDDPWSYYNMACYYSLTMDTSRSLQYLEMALEMGFDNYLHIETDHDLDNIRNTKAFEALMTKYLN